MKKQFFLRLLILICFLVPSTGLASILGAPHLLHLVRNKIKRPAGIEAQQSRKVLNYQNFEKPYFEFQEKLIYSYPGHLRINTLSQPLANFSVESDSKFIKISDGVITSLHKSLTDLYSDILLYRDNEHCLSQLDLWGIDTTKITFQRYDDKICYVIGKPQKKDYDFPGLWIEKETFLPIKYVVKKDNQKIKFLYKNWQKVSRTFYPMQIHIFLNDRLYAFIKVESFIIKSTFLPHLFDIDGFLNSYPINDTAHENAINKEIISGGNLESIPEKKQIYE
jgi:hypothetical protein